MERPFPAYRGDAPYIFVSYSHDDADLVYPEIKRLRDEGFNIWYDEGISPGSTWRDEVALALTQCKLFLYYISPRAIRSENCLQELNFALSRERKVLAVHLEPTELSMGVELSLSNKQAIMKADHSDTDYYRKLTDSLQSMLPQTEPAAPAPVDRPSAPAEPPEEKSIAILPLTNRSSDEEIEYLCDGTAEELINGLSKLDDLRVASQLTTFALKNQGYDIKTIGERLHVSHVLSGSVQKSGNRVRVNVSLNDVSRDHAVWTERYDGTLDDVFELQESVARNVVDSLKVRLGDDSNDARLIDVGTADAQAYNAFLLGVHSFEIFTARAMATAIDHFNQAVALDPNFGRAWWFMFLAYWILWDQFGESMEDLVPRAREAGEQLWKTDFAPPMPRIQILRTVGDAEFDERTLALEAIDKVRNPDHEWESYANWQLGIRLGGAGFIHGATAYLKRYGDSMPSQSHQDTNFSNFYTQGLDLLGRFDEAIEYIDTELAANRDQPLRLGVRAMTYSRTGQYRKAEEDLRELAKTYPRNFAQFYHLFWTREMEAAKEYYAWLESQPRLLPLFKYWGAFLLGDIDKGVDYLIERDATNVTNTGRAWVCNVGSVAPLPQSTMHQVRNHPRHRALMESLGYTDAWRAELLERVNELETITGITVKPDEEY